MRPVSIGDHDYRQQADDYPIRFLVDRAGHDLERVLAVITSVGTVMHVADELGHVEMSVE